MSNSKPNSLIHYVDFNSSKIKGSKPPLVMSMNHQAAELETHEEGEGWRDKTKG
jgi:hypothetical protein